MQPATKRSVRPRPVLHSAFPDKMAEQATKPRQVQECAMVECEFTFSVAVISETIDVTFESIPEKKTILIAQDWKQGEDVFKAGKPYFNTGLIGQGYTKHGIYVIIAVILSY